MSPDWEKLIEAGNALADALRSMDSYAAWSRTAPLECSDRAIKALLGWRVALEQVPRPHLAALPAEPVRATGPVRAAAEALIEDVQQRTRAKHGTRGPVDPSEVGTAKVAKLIAALAADREPEPVRVTAAFLDEIESRLEREIKDSHDYSSSRYRAKDDGYNDGVYDALEAVKAALSAPPPEGESATEPGRFYEQHGSARRSPASYPLNRLVIGGQSQSARRRDVSASHATLSNQQQGEAMSATVPNAYCIIHGTPGKDPLSIEGPFETEADAQANADADRKARPDVPVMVDVLFQPGELLIYPPEGESE